LAKARIAFRFGHFGDCFHGSQIQPDIPTVQGTFIHIFQKKLKWTTLRIPVAFASRTDAGVHVRLNGGYIDLDEDQWNPMGPDGFLKAVGHQIPDTISLIDAQRVADDWSPRRALRRTYRYRMECMEGWAEPEFEEFAKWCKVFEGKHDWANYSRTEVGRSTVRVVESCKPWFSEDRIIGFEIIGEAFVWNQVRRIANALHGLVTKYRSLEQVEQALHHPEKESDLGLAESDWLILWSVEWEGIPNIESEQTLVPKPDKSSARWQHLCRQQQKEILIRQFDFIEGRY